MSSGVITGSGPKPPACWRRAAAGGGGGGRSSSWASLRINISGHLLPTGRRWAKSLFWASSSPSASSFRARASASSAAAVEDGVAGAKGGSFYELLGIPEGGSSAEIKRAYKEMARRYHPDVCPSPDCTKEYTRRFIEVQEAYETLSDPGLRALYDRDLLARGLHLASFSARKRCRRRYDDDHHEELVERSQWRNLWQDQVAELKRRSMSKDSGSNMSWGARMRRQREEESSTE